MTTLEELLPLVEHATTAREFGVAVIALVPAKPRGLKRKLALAARDALGRPWTDKTVKYWLLPSNHTEERQEADRARSRDAARRWREENPGATKRWREENREAHKGAVRRRYEENREKEIVRCRQWKAENPEKVREAAQRWYGENPGYYNEYKKVRRSQDPAFALACATRTRINSALCAAVGSPGKAGPALELLGCSADEFRLHLEGLWEPGMSWDNWGDWHVDHVVPVAAHDLTTDEGQRAAFHFTNCQPLWAGDNLSKGSLHDGVRHRLAQQPTTTTMEKTT